MIGGGVRESPLRFDYWRTLPHRAHVLKANAFWVQTQLRMQKQRRFVLFCFPPLLLMSMDPVFSQRDAFYYATILLSCQLSWLDSSSIWFCKWSPKSHHFITFTGVEMKAYSKVQAGRDGCYFLLNSFTANDIFCWITPVVFNSQRQIVKSDSLCNFDWIQFWVITRLYGGISEKKKYNTYF